MALPASPTWAEVKEALSNADAHITTRYKSLMESRQVAPSNAELVDVLMGALQVQRTSILLRHEIAYVLGQVGDTRALDTLRSLLADEKEDAIVRHEAAEGIAAVGGDQDTINELAEHQTGRGPLADTCELAIEGLKRRATGNALPVCACQYSTKDPALGLDGVVPEDIPRLADMLINQDAALFERYEAMFSLRNLGGRASIDALCETLLRDRSSEVLRHEVAFVLGQLEDEVAGTTLAQVLASEDEHLMVRHEAAIALGNIGSCEAEAALNALTGHWEPMVAESCQVAIATLQYWRLWEEREAQILSSS
mmetsp:Transcript_8954/g.24973  ORF Transcript_8954/g.24973 Transcript_8954/m.24973 type:complete len:310 (-) Transcript_8954:112-1041(-)